MDKQNIIYRCVFWSDVRTNQLKWMFSISEVALQEVYCAIRHRAIWTPVMTFYLVIAWANDDSLRELILLAENFSYSVWTSIRTSG